MDKCMRRLLLKTIIFTCILFSFIAICILISSKSDLLNHFFGKITNSTSYDREEVNGGPAEIIPSIEMVQKKDQYTKLVIGDSVCCRVFNGVRGYNKDYLMLGTNQAISMTGQFLLAKEFINNHPTATDIYIIVIPSSFQSDFDLKLGYQYAVTPFVETNLFNNLDLDIIQRAESVYGKYFIQSEIVRCIDYSEMNRKIYLNLLYKYGKNPKNEGLFISDSTIIALKRLDGMCKENNVKLHILPGPIPENQDNHFIISQKAEFEKNSFGELMELYYNSITLYPLEYFPDGTHPGGDYGTRKELKKIVRN